MGYILVIAVALTIAYRCTTPAERKQYWQSAAKAAGTFWRRAGGWWQETESFRATLRARTPVAPAMPLIAAINVAIVLGMLMHDARPLGDPEALVAWGGSVGPRTANGEWWRLITASFVHDGVFSLVISLIAFIPLGLVLERVVGPMAFTAVYLTAGLFSTLFNVSVFPVDVSVGSIGAVAGAHGFMLAVSLWGVSQQPRLTMPLIAAEWLAGCAALFAAYVVATDAAPVAVVGFVSGLVPGLLVARGVNTRRTPATRMVATVVTMACVAIVTAVPLRGITDARRHIEEVIEVEERTAETFRTALEEFGLGRMSAVRVADIIDQVIVPEVKHQRDRLDRLEGVPAGQRPLIEAAVEYLRLRDESWAIRSTAFRTGKMKTLRAADETEAASMQAFKRLNSQSPLFTSQSIPH